MFSSFIMLLLLKICMIIFYLKGLIIVRQQEAVIIETLGKYSRTLSPGFNIIIPFLDKPRQIMKIENIRTVDGKIISKFVPSNVIDLRETVLSIQNQTVNSNDNNKFEINLYLYCQITNPRKAVYMLENLPSALQILSKNKIHDIAKQHTSYDIEIINEELRLILDKSADKWGVKVNDVEIKKCEDARYSHGDYGWDTNRYVD